MTLKDILTDFQKCISSSKAAISNAHVSDSSGRYIFDKQSRHFITESAFLNLFKGWELFLENTFISYMMGKLSMSSHKFTCYAKPLNRQHAYRIITGNQKYFDWSTPESVRKLSNNFFNNGDPYDLRISSIHQDIQDMKTVRNSTAHNTQSTGTPLDALASRKLLKSVSNIRAAEFLLSLDPISTTNNTFYLSYSEILEITADNIAHA